MKAAGRLAKLESANLPALRLAAVKSFDEKDGDFLASVLCALAERGATFPACDELRAMNARHSAFMAAKTDEELAAIPTPAHIADWSDGYLVAVMLWDTFCWMPRAWQAPGASARLLAELAEEASEFEGKSKSEIKAMLDYECDKLRKKNDELFVPNPT